MNKQPHTQHTQAEKSASADAQLRALLQLKQYEQPGADAWEGFEARVQQRCLRTLMQKQPVQVRAAAWVKARAHVLAPLGAAAALIFSVQLASIFMGPATTAAPTTTYAQAQNLNPGLSTTLDTRRAQYIQNEYAHGAANLQAEPTLTTAGQEAQGIVYVAGALNTPGVSAASFPVQYAQANSMLF